MRKLLSPDAPSGGGPQDPPPPSPAPAAPAGPPAALVVLNGKSERELTLEKDLAEKDALLAQKDADIRKAQTDAAYAQDEARRLKEAVTPPPTPKKKKGTPWTFFHPEE